MDAVVYTTDEQEYEMLCWILKEESPGLTVSRGRIEGEYHLEKEYDVAVVGINGTQKNFVCTNKGVLYDTSTNYSILVMSQIQRHFICNTLGTIEQLCMEQPEIASKLVHDFSLYLRGNFREMNSNVPIPLSQEIEHVRHYVAIEQIRFPDMTIQFELHSEEFLLPPLTIQPLVENAIRHGLMGVESGGTIIISTYETDLYYCVSVVDDGVGFKMPLTADGRLHIGIHNIEGRLESMCGGTLTVESLPGKGTKALIRIPREEIQA